MGFRSFDLYGPGWLYCPGAVRVDVDVLPLLPLPQLLLALLLVLWEATHCVRHGRVRMVQME